MTATQHLIRPGDARDLGALAEGSVHCIVTSPPYPMIEMWDEVFAGMNPAVGEALADGRARDAFLAMHAELDRAWAEIHRVLIDGGIACINIGDATRTIGERFTLWPNHARILEACGLLGFDNLPAILWRKPTNAPNKFMGSGMLPAGAYVTLEHEWILVLRKGGKRVFKSDAERAHRRKSAFFWEERNAWFSDVWFDIRGATQDLPRGETRDRSAAFPFAIAHRLVNMFTVKGDTVLDPFLGTGTTTLAAMAAERNSIGIEPDAVLREEAGIRAVRSLPPLNAHRGERLLRHAQFVKERTAAGKTFRHHNTPHNTPCISAQERDLRIRSLADITRISPDKVQVDYTE